MSAVWLTIAVLTVGTFGMKVVGPLVLGERPPSERMLAMTGLVAPALLAAFVVYETFSADGQRHHARRPRRRASAPRSSRSSLRAPMLVVVLVAAAATAGVRAFS